jgi:hypothetical protein
VRSSSEAAQLLDRLDVESLPRQGSRIAQGEAAIDFAARDPSRDQLAQPRLGRAQFLRDAELQIEKARIHRAQLDRQRAARRIGTRDGVAGHAMDHGDAGIIG